LRKSKILILGDINSIHLQKCIVGFEKDFDICIFSLDPANELTKSKFTGINLITNESIQTGGMPKLFYLLSLFKLKKIYKEFKPDIVHAHYATSYGLLGRLLFHSNFFISAWGSDVFIFPNKSKLHRIVLTFILNGAKRIYSTSHVMAKELEKYSNSEIKVIPFGVNTNLFRSSKIKVNSNPFVFGTVKTLEEVYGIDKLILAFYEFHKIHDNSKCYIYGKGSKFIEYSNLVTKLNLCDVVIFKGAIPNNEVPKALEELDVFCAFSRSESFGVSIIEAAACEVPSIVSNVGGLPEVVQEGVTGFVIDPTIENIVDKMTLLYSNEILRKQMGKQAREFILKEFDWENNLIAMKMEYNFYV
jgi:L-malate glycosyltransferase